ncbi:MAG TPA: hypothetical protein ENK83_04120, partial [Aliiroseovarius sp.]|nr:hypothetical protein [Aliiroseovarius sp.]
MSDLETRFVFFLRCECKMIMPEQTPIPGKQMPRDEQTMTANAQVFKPVDNLFVLAEEAVKALEPMLAAAREEIRGRVTVEGRVSAPLLEVHQHE